MPTRGGALYFKQNVNLFLSLLFIASFSLACGLILWHAAFGTNPVEKILLSTALADSTKY